MAYELIETIEVGAGGAASIEFTSIPQDGVDLLLLLSTRRNAASNVFYINLNGGGAGTHQTIELRGDGSSVRTGNYTDEVFYSDGQSSATTANTFSNMSVYISNYTSSNNKAVSIDSVTENNGTTAYAQIAAGGFTTSDPITSIETLYSSVAEYSTASLYKITAD